MLTWISVLGVAVGVMTLIVVLSVMKGFEEDLKQKIVGVNPHVVIAPFADQTMWDFQEVLKTLQKTPKITAASPYVEGQALIRSRSRAVGAAVFGINPEDFSGLVDLDRFLIESEVKALSPRSAGGSGRTERIFLGLELARRLEVHPGDDVILFVPVLRPTPLGPMPKSMRFQVAGLFSTGMYDYDTAFAYTDLTVARQLWETGEGVSAVAAKVKDVDEAAVVAERLRDIFFQRYFVQDWLQRNRNLFLALHTEKIVMGIILSLIVLVAALNIINPLTMMVIEKTREIGILKSMGASDFSIRFLFWFQGMVIGFLGTLLGTFLGWGLCEVIQAYPIPIPGGGAVYYIERLPVRVEAWLAYGVIPGVSLLLCFLATLYPARQAARLDPTEAIRYA